MSKRQKAFIWISSLSIAGCWAILAFFLKEELIPRFSLWASLIVGTATTITSLIALFISALTYRKHEEEKKQKREEEAKLFLHDNYDEVGYLPYCIYASCYDRHGHHARKIYNEFCRLSDEMQKEVLKQANYKMELIEGTDWIHEKIELIDRFANEYGFGDTFLYDSGKYLLRGYDYKNEPYIEDHTEELQDVFGIYTFLTRIIKKPLITIDQYYEGYGYRRFRDPKWLERYKYLPPGDVLIDIKKLRDPLNTSDHVVAFWLCHEIENLFACIVEYFYGKEPDGIISGDAQPEFFEDKFYIILNILYCLDDYSKYQLILKEPYDKKERDEIENNQ